MKIFFGVIWLPIRFFVLFFGGRQVPIVKGLVEWIDSAFK